MSASAASLPPGLRAELEDEGATVARIASSRFRSHLFRFETVYGPRGSIDGLSVGNSQRAWVTFLHAAAQRYPTGPVAKALAQHVRAVKDLSFDAGHDDLDLAPFGVLRQLRTLSLVHVATARGALALPATLRSFVLEAIQLKPDARVTSPHRLGRLDWTVRRGGLPALDGLEVKTAAVTSVHLDDLEPLRTWRGLERLTLITPEVRDLAALGVHKQLEILHVEASHPDFAGWREDAPVALERLHCHKNCRQLVRLDGLDACPRLRRVAVGETRVTDVSALRDHPTLETLDLSRLKKLRDLRPLGFPPQLKVLQATGLRFDVKRVHPEVALRVKPPGAIKRGRSKATAKARAKSKSGLDARSRSLHAKLEKLLLSRDLEHIEQGAELCAGLDDPSVLEAFLEGTSFVTPNLLESRFHSTGALQSSSVVAVYRRHAMRMLAALAPAGSRGAALRDEVTTLALDGRRTRKEVVPISLAAVHRFEALETLVLHDASTLVRTAALASAPRLRSLAMREIATPVPLQLPTSLRRLRLDRYPLERLGASAGCLQVEELDCTGPLPDAATLGRFGGLRHLRLEPGWLGGELGVGHIAALPTALQSLDLRHCRLDHFGALARLEGLERLVVGRVGRLEALALLPVKELWLMSWKSNGPVDLAPLAANPRLRRLGVLTSAERIRNVKKLSQLEVLWTYHATPKLERELGGRWRSAGDVLPFPRWFDDAVRP